MSDHFHLETSDVEVLSNKIPGQDYKGDENYNWADLNTLGFLKLNEKYIVSSEDFYIFVPDKREVEYYRYSRDMLKDKVFVGVLEEIKHEIDDTGNFVRFSLYFRSSKESQVNESTTFNYSTTKTLELAKSLTSEENAIHIKSPRPDVTLSEYLKRFKEYVPVVRDQCPSDTIDPPYECDKKTLLKLHPDKNPGCKGDATEKQKVYNNQCYSKGGKKSRKKNHSKKSKGRKKKGPKKTLKRGKKKTKRSRH